MFMKIVFRLRIKRWTIKTSKEKVGKCFETVRLFIIQCKIVISVSIQVANANFVSDLLVLWLMTRVLLLDEPLSRIGLKS